MVRSGVRSDVEAAVTSMVWCSVGYRYTSCSLVPAIFRGRGLVVACRTSLLHALSSKQAPAPVAW